MHVKTLLPLLLFATLLASCAPRHFRSYKLMPITADSLANLDYNIDEYREKYDGEDGVFIKSSDVVEHLLSGQNWHAYRTSALRFMVLNPEADWLTTFRLRIDPGERLMNSYIIVRSPDGRVTSYGAKDMKMEKDSDGSLFYRFAYPDVQIGTIIEEGYDIFYAEGSSLAHESFPLQFHVPCEELKIKIGYPSNFEMKVKKTAPGKTPKTSIDHSARYARAIVYEDEDIPAVVDEIYAPFEKEMIDYLEYAVVGISSYSFIPSWERFADTYKEFAMDRGSAWRDRPGKVVKEIITDGMSDVKKLETIVTWIQQNIELDPTAMGYDFNDVISRKKGSPIVITSLARQMLEQAGIDASFILAHSAEEGYFDHDFVTFGVLRTPAVYTEVEGREYVVFPYLKHYPIDLIPEYIQGQQAIRINGDGYNGFVSLPYSSSNRNTRVENYTLDIDEEGVIRVSEEKELNGSIAYTVRRSLTEITEEEMEELMNGLLTYDEGDVELTDYEILNRDDFSKPLIIKLHYEIDNLVTVTPEEIIFQTAGLLSPSSSSSTKVEVEERINPIRVYYNEGLAKNITIRYPSTWNLSSQPKDVEYSNKFGEIFATYSSAPGSLTVEMRRTLNQINEPSTEFQGLMNIIGKRSQLQVPTLIFAVEG